MPLGLSVPHFAFRKPRELSHSQMFRQKSTAFMSCRSAADFPPLAWGAAVARQGLWGSPSGSVDVPGETTDSEIVLQSSLSRPFKTHLRCSSIVLFWAPVSRCLAVSGT